MVYFLAALRLSICRAFTRYMLRLTCFIIKHAWLYTKFLFCCYLFPVCLSLTFMCLLLHAEDCALGSSSCIRLIFNAQSAVSRLMSAFLKTLSLTASNVIPQMTLSLIKDSFNCPNLHDLTLSLCRNFK